MNASVLPVDPSLPRNVFSLNGTWEIQPGGEDVPTEAWKRRVQVPGLVDCALPEYDWRQHAYHWYRTVLKIDTPFPPESAMLTFEQAMFGTQVWLNGRRVGCDIACYTSQEYDVRDFLIPGAANELLVRVGAKETLPQETAVGRDQERTDFIPGIWGDVHLTLCGNPRIKLVQIIPHIETGAAETRLWMVNNSADEISTDVALRVREKRSQNAASEVVARRVSLRPGEERCLTFNVRVPEPRLWTPEHPFLYELDAYVLDRQSMLDRVLTTFGMREFKVAGSDFLLNGKKIYLRGGNIAFHRFLSDAERGLLPWNMDWIRKLLIEIPKAHHFNFFRNHLGQMYNRWYDIADEHGMLLQNEWMFWTTTGSKEQIGKEFTQWLRDNWNHPSIVIWDALNECSDDAVQKEIVPEMKKLDPTRPWESVDFVEQHPYIYSLGPVLVDRKFGFTESLEAIEKSPTTSMVNEFLWWWLDKDLNPSLLTKEVIERWLGPGWTTDQLIAHQSFLAQELVELFRRMRVDAIQPFVYLSNNGGPTGHWFIGDIKDLQPKPILAALKNAFAPFGVSIELWDRHFYLDEHRAVRIFIFNDEPSSRNGTVRYGIRSMNGEWVSEKRTAVAVGSSGCSILPLGFSFPSEASEYRACAELYEHNRLVAYSEKIVFAFRRLQPPDEVLQRPVGILGASRELTEFLSSFGANVTSQDGANLPECDVLVVGEGAARTPVYQSHLREITDFLESGKTMVVLEPEFGVEGKEFVTLAPGLDLALEKRKDIDRGGYDSYVFAEDSHHPLWNGISPEHLKMFNGSYGGEIVSQHDVTPNTGAAVLARCGLKLKTAAVFEVPVKKGRVIVSRLQLRGRLVPTSNSQELFARRVDPVAQRYLLNLLFYAER